MSDMTPDLNKARREGMRWYVLLTLNNGRPVAAHEAVILNVVQAVYPDATPIEVRRELQYLEERHLVSVNRAPSGPWSVELTRHGIDIAEYTVDCQPGIARPIKYW